MNFPNDLNLVLDEVEIRQRINSLATELAAADERAGLIPELDVSTTATTGWLVADTLDYDCRFERNNRRRTIIRVIDVERTREEVKAAKETATPIVKRALNAFNRDINAAIAVFEANRVSAKGREMLNVLEGRGLSDGTGHSLGRLVELYNELMALSVSPDRNIVSNDSEKILIRNAEDRTFASLRPRFWRSPANRQIITLYQAHISEVGSYDLRSVYRSLVTDNASLLTASDGHYCNEQLDSVDLGLWAVRQILINFKEMGLKQLGDQITERCERLASLIGPVTLSSAGGSSVTINPAVAQAA